MSGIVNVQAVNFCNQKVRPMADVMSQSYFTAKAIVDYWNANSMANLISNNSAVVNDGAAADGRQILTGQEATAIITEAMAIITHYEAGSNAVLNVVDGVAVNGGSRF